MRNAVDRIGIGLAWLCGLTLVATIGGIIVWLGWNGIGEIDFDFLWSDPAPGTLERGVVGGVRAPLVGTLLLTVIGCLIALPLGVGAAVFLAEYRRPAWLARAVESAVEVLFAIPAIVFALFGLAIFTSSNLIFLSSEVESSGNAFGRSFLTAGIMMSLIAIPPIVLSTRAVMASIPNDLREASYGLGKGKLATIRRVIVPGSRQGIATGVILGAGRIAGDTAIVWLLLGGVITPQVDQWYEPQQWVETLRGTGASLTSYIYYASPVGEGNSESAAYGAAFVLIVLMLLINSSVLLISRRGAWKR